MKLSKRLGSAILLVAVLWAWFHQIQLVYFTQIHWDEFYFLSKIHAHQDDRWFHTIQSIYVHWFSWVTWLSENEVEQVLYGRLFTVVFFVVYFSTTDMALEAVWSPVVSDNEQTDPDLRVPNLSK